MISDCVTYFEISANFETELLFAQGNYHYNMILYHLLKVPLATQDFKASNLILRRAQDAVLQHSSLFWVAVLMVSRSLIGNNAIIMMEHQILA